MKLLETIIEEKNSTNTEKKNFVRFQTIEDTFIFDNIKEKNLETTLIMSLKEKAHNYAITENQKTHD